MSLGPAVERAVLFGEDLTEVGAGREVVDAAAQLDRAHGLVQAIEGERLAHDAVRDVVVGEDGIACGLRPEARAARDGVARRGDGDEGGQCDDGAREDDLGAKAN